MRKLRAIIKVMILFFSLLLLPVCVFSDGLVVSGSLDLESSLALITQVVPGVSLTWQFGTLGVGAELDLPVGLAQGDMYMVALILGKVGWLRIGLGLSTMLLLPANNGPYILPEPHELVLKIGIAIPGWKAGPGTIGIDLFGEVFETATPGSGFDAEMLSLQNMFKVGIGLNYSVSF